LGLAISATSIPSIPTLCTSMAQIPVIHASPMPLPRTGLAFRVGLVIDRHDRPPMADFRDRECPFLTNFLKVRCIYSVV